MLITGIIKNELELFVDKLSDSLKFYSKGIFYSGKITVKKKLKLKIDRTKKYDFTHSDSLFIENYIVEKLPQFENMLKYASVGYITEEITKAIREQWNIETEEDGKFVYNKQELIDDELDEITEIVLSTTYSIYDELLETTIKEAILLFKRGQLEEYKNLNINKVTIKSSNDSSSCNVCKVRSNNVLDVNDLTKEFDLNQDIIHPFCKITIEPVINYDALKSKINKDYNLSESAIVDGMDNLHLNTNIETNIKQIVLGKLTFNNVPIETEERINKLFSKIKIYLSDYIKQLEFEFVKDIVDLEVWFNDYKSQYLEKGEFKSDNEAYIAQDKLKGLISSYKTGNKIYISNFSMLTENIEDVIIREMFRDFKVEDQQWWKEKYEEGIKDDKIGEGLSLTKSIFVNYLSRESLEDFILESIVFYINNPNTLRGIDEKVYNKIKSNFNGIQFF